MINGTGFLPEDDNKGMGLRLIGHRIDLLGGTFTIDKLPDSEEFMSCVKYTFPVKSIME